MVVGRTELLSSTLFNFSGCVPWKWRTGEGGVVVMHRPFSSPVFSGGWHSGGVCGWLTGLGCEVALATEVLESPAGWQCGRTDALTVAIILDFLKLVVGSTITVGEMTAGVRLGRWMKWFASSGVNTVRLPEGACPPSSSATHCWSAHAILHSSKPSTTRWKIFRTSPQHCSFWWNCK